MLKKLGKGAFG